MSVLSSHARSLGGFSQNGLGDVGQYSLTLQLGLDRGADITGQLKVTAQVTKQVPSQEISQGS